MVKEKGVGKGRFGGGKQDSSIVNQKISKDIEIKASDGEVVK